jgi:hypothetical protein
MGKKDWHGIMKILEIQHIHNGCVIWERKNLRNLLHYEGEAFLLRAAFTGGVESTVIPENYYLGLDNRTTIAVSDDMSDISGEPISNGYARQPISSSGQFVVTRETLTSHFTATCPIVVFRASGGSFGPVKQLFLTDKDDNSGSLISSVSLESPLTVPNGDSVRMRIQLAMRDCP